MTGSSVEDERSIESVVVNDKEVASGSVVSGAVPDRRRLFRRLLALAGLGITGALLSQDKMGFLSKVDATNTPVTTDSPLNVIGTLAFWDGSTSISSDTLLYWTNSNGLFSEGTYLGVEGISSSVGVLGVTENASTTYLKSGVQGVALTGHGVIGQSTSGVGVAGQAVSPSAIPIVAQGYSGQSANLQEWQNSSKTAVATVDSAGRFSSNAVNAEYRLVGQETNGRTWRLFSDGTSFNFTDATAGQNIAVFATDAVTFTRRLLPSPAGALDLGIVGLQWNHVTANQFVTISQSTLKHDIAPVEDLDYLSNVPAPIYYKLNKAPDNQTYLGFIGDGLPELAKAEGGGVYLNAVIGILSGAIKQQQDEIQQLRDEVQELKSQIAS